MIFRNGAYDNKEQCMCENITWTVFILLFYIDEQAFAAWANRIVVNKCYNHIKMFLK